ncbi:MAG: hypothetical protein L0227_01100 [Chloroflexi bacterium]|nr:hypothetical protein [Chloroflexota bacterium]
MPFGLGRKKEAPPPELVESASGAAERGPRVIEFLGVTEEWRLKGTMSISGRLLDVLNKRDAINLSDVSWAPLDGSGSFAPAPGIQAVDPYDLIVVMAGRETLSAVGEDERAAHRIHKITFDVALLAPPLRVVGTVQLNPGTEPDGLLERSSQMFVAVTGPTIWLAGTQVEFGEAADAALVNRYYLRGVEQVDLATGERHQRLPGTPLGGTNWRERS